LAIDEEINVFLGYSLLGKTADAQKSASAYAAGVIEKSSLLSIPASIEKTGGDTLGFLTEQISGNKVTDSDLEKLENLNNLRKYRKVQQLLHHGGDIVDPASAERGRASAPTLEFAASLALMGMDAPGLFMGMGEAEAGLLAPVRGARAGEGLLGAAADSRAVWSSAAGDVVVEGTSLPGRAGVAVSRRLTALEMAALQQSHGVEFALIYELGPGTGGGGGRYLLFSGEHTRVWFPPNRDYIWISHSHPEGYPLRASTDDRLWLQQMQRNGSPQNTSTVIPVDGKPFRFNANQSRLGGN
jgi:hypothetical protein